LGALSQMELPEHLSTLITSEMVGRLLKQELNTHWRAVEYGNLVGQRECVVRTLNSCFSPDDSDDALWWSQCIAGGLLERYGCELQLTQVKPLWMPVLETLSRLCGIQFDLASISSRTSVFFKLKDIVAILPRLRSADAMLYIEHGAACEPGAVLKLLNNCGERTEAMRIGLQLAKVALAAGSFQEALELARKALGDHPAECARVVPCALAAQVQTVILLAAANQGHEYSTHLEAVVHTLTRLDMNNGHPLSSELQEELGMLCASRSDWAGCRRHFRSAVDQFEQSCAEHRKLAKLWLQLAMASSEPTDKAEALSRAVYMADVTANEQEPDGEAAGCMFHCASGLLELEEPKKAKHWSERALRLVPKGQLAVAKLRTKLQGLISHIDTNFVLESQPEETAAADGDSCRSPLSPSALTNSLIATKRQSIKESPCRRDTLTRAQMAAQMDEWMKELDEEEPSPWIL